MEVRSFMAIAHGGQMKPPGLEVVRLWKDTNCWVEEATVSESCF